MEFLEIKKEAASWQDTGRLNSKINIYFINHPKVGGGIDLF